MSKLKRYQNNLILKAVIIPLIITVIACAVLVLAQPIIQNVLPNGVEYAQQYSADEVAEQ